MFGVKFIFFFGSFYAFLGTLSNNLTYTAVKITLVNRRQRCPINPPAA
jgi:hypothetical protein